MFKDPIVEEVRQIREKIFAECDCDFKKLAKRNREIMKRWKGKVVTREELFAQRKARQKTVERGT